MQVLRLVATAMTARLSIALTVILLLACDTSLENRQLGVLRDDRDRIHIIYLGCKDKGERVIAVELVRVHGSLGGGDDKVVWREESADGLSSVDLIVGEGAEDFRETVPLSDNLQGKYTVVVTTSLQDDVAQVVEVDSLNHGLVDTGSGNPISLQGFRETATESCG